MKKLFSILNKKQKLMTKGIYDKFIYSNNHVDIIHDSCKICYNKKKEETREDKLNYIERRVKTGHESILEHSNIIMYLIIEKNSESLMELLEITELSKYLNIKTRVVSNEVHVLIGGSLRGYKHIFRNILNQDNYIANAILNNLYSTNKEYFTDFIEDNIMQEKRFNDLNYTYPSLISNKIINPNLQIINMDDIKYIYKEIEYIFTLDELLDVCTITILFNDISRIISQQLTRHRNAITQLSQRYVDYSSSDFGFNSPTKYKSTYDENHHYLVYFNNILNELTLQDLGNEIMGIYNQLCDRKLGEHRLVPEDARAYLPNNAQTSLYMTFTFKSLIKFLALRTDMHAQAEIRLLAQSIENEIQPIIDNILGTNMYNSLTPKYKQMLEGDYSNIDEIIE